MSFGLEVFDANGKPIMSVGPKYLNIIGEFYAPAGSRAGNTRVEHNFTIPNTIPQGEKVFIIGSAVARPTFYEVIGAQVRVVPTSTYNRNARVTNYRAVKLYYGYYA